LQSGFDGNTWAQFTHVCGGTDGYGVPPFDSATLFYNKKEWDVMNTGGSPQAPIGGCMERVAYDEAMHAHVLPNESGELNYRAFILQAFKHKRNGTEIIVLVSHHPHIYQSSEYDTAIRHLEEALDRIRHDTGVGKVVVLADTNWPESKPSQSIMNDIYADAHNVVSTELQKTCCQGGVGYFAAYDRIIAAGFPLAMNPIKTSLPFGLDSNDAPSWAALNMHSPITGVLSYAGS
jgi:hypothetical protein